MRGIRLWDANRRYTEKFYAMQTSGAWQDRASWTQVPVGATDYSFKGDAILEGENFWIFLHSTRHDAVFLYAKTDAEGTPGRHNELYRVFDASDGRRNYGEGSQSVKVVKNESDEIAVLSRAHPHARGGTVATIYRILKGRRWLEIRPMWQADEQGMHGESRILIAPEAGENGQDWADDSLKHPDRYVTHLPNGAKMLLDLIMDDDTIWALTWPGAKKANAAVAQGGWHAGWSRIGEGDCDRVWTAPFAFFAGEPVFIGVCRIGFWHYQRVGAQVKAGAPFTGKWRWAYERPITSSPFSKGEAWRPLYPGRWRLVGRVDGRFYTNEVIVADTTQDGFAFTSPAGGTLEYLVFYLYDRTEQTPKEISTPMDIYRETRLVQYEGGTR